MWPERRIRWPEVPFPVRGGNISSSCSLVQVPRDEARRVLRMRWSRKPEVTDFKVDRRVV